MFVVSEHVVTQTQPVVNAWVSGYSMLGHFTRNAFVFITAFVLFYGNHRRRVELVPFWRKRICLVLWPYLVWSTVFYLLSWSLNGSIPSPGKAVHDWALDLLWGAAWFHIYFLLVSIQFYLLFPVFRTLLRRFTDHYRPLLVGSLLINVAFMVMLEYIPAPSGWLGALWAHGYVLFPTYLFVMTVGSMAGANHERVREWVLNHRDLIVGGLVGALVITLVWFAFRITLVGTWRAADATDPMQLIWVTAVIFALFTLGSSWALHRGDGRGLLGRIVDFATVRAFGVFLCHPLILFVLQKAIGRWVSTVPYGPLQALLYFVPTTLLALAFTELALRTPLSRPLVGRPRL